MERINSSGDEPHKCNLSKMLRRALQDSQREIQELAAENAHLKELEAERARLEELEDVNALLDELEAKCASLEEQEDVNSRLEELEAENTWLKELEVLNGRLEAENALLKAENARVKDLEAENPRLKKLRAENVALKKQITMKNISWGEERKKVAEKLESSASLLLKSKDDLTSLIQLVESEKAKEKELEKELRNMNMRFKLKEVEVVSLNADLKLQEDKLQRYILENEGRPEEIEELHKKMRDLDESWSTEHKESPEKEIKLEDDIKLPIQQNIVLQEQALKTDSYKERVKKEKEEKKERKKSGKEEKMEKREKEEIEGTTRRRLPCFLFNFKPS